MQKIIGLVLAALVSVTLLWGAFRLAVLLIPLMQEPAFRAGLYIIEGTIFAIAAVVLTVRRIRKYGIRFGVVQPLLADCSDSEK